MQLLFLKQPSRQLKELCIILQDLNSARIFIYLNALYIQHLMYLIALFWGAHMLASCQVLKCVKVLCYSNFFMTY